MLKKLLTTGRLTAVIIILLGTLFFTQYTSYSVILKNQLQENAQNRLSQIHNAVSEDAQKALSESNMNLPLFLTRFSIHIQYPGTYALLVDNSGMVLDSDEFLTSGENLWNDLASFSLTGELSKSAFLERSLSGESLMTEVRNTVSGISYYLYSEPLPDTSWILMVLSQTEIIDGEIRSISSSASNFIITCIIIVITLCAWLSFVHFFDSLKLNHSKQALLSERRRYKLALARNNNYIWEYYLTTDQMIWDESNSVTDIIIDVTSSKRKELINNNIIHPEDQWAFFHFCDSMMTSEPTIEVELRAKDHEDNYIWYRLSGTKVLDTDGYPVSIVGQTTNIDSQKKEYEVLCEYASQDPLTKLYNYKAFTEKANERISTMEEPVILSLLLIDVDNFSNLNETFGYVFADAVLIDLAGRLKKLFGDNCLLGRFGADEFVVFLDNVPSMTYVIDMAQHILNSFHNIFSNTKTDYSLSCCVGISVYPVDATSYDGLFAKADIALYDAKHRGKGRYSVYNNSMAAIPEAEQYRKINKQNQQTSSLFETRTVIDSTIIANAIDILFDSRDINVSINMMLSLIGIYYNLDHIFIMEYEKDSDSSTVSHEWSSDSAFSFTKQQKSVTHPKSTLFCGFESNQQGTYRCDDTSACLQTLEIKQDEYLENVRSLIQCGIHYQDSFIGHINICTVENTRVWSESEIDSLTLLSKLIGSYLLHLHSQERIDYVSQMDVLTNTYNFNAFLNKANELISTNTNKKYAAIYSDVHQFKLINDNYGYRAGDYILTTIAGILQQIGGADSLIARITGDKFVALYPYTTIDELTELVKTIVYESKRIKQPNGDFYRLVLMIGIYPVTEGDSAIVAVDRANIARKNVIDYHICNYMYYNETMHNNLVEQKEIEDSMEEALRNHEFVVFYQPKVDIVTKQIVGSEALVRWQRPNVGMIPPIRFIPLFEENGFIVALDYYVLDTVCASLRTLIDSSRRVYPVSVNFSRIHFNSNMFPTVIRATLERYNIPPYLIEVEITESALAASDNYQLSILNEVHSIGCRLSMDDFGSGMSSLNILRDLPFDILKIDKDFLHSKATSVRERVVITNVVRMAFDLDMDVICEGVETVEQEHFLKRIGCFTAQGFLYAEPMPEELFVKKYLEVKASDEPNEKGRK